MDAKHKEHVTPEDFGISNDDAKKARYYANFLILMERERCAKLCEALSARTDDETGATIALKWAADAIRA